MTEYYFKRTEKGCLIFKDDFDQVMYEITDNTCTCPGCTYHKVRCKHLLWFTNAILDPKFTIDSIFEYDPLHNKLILWESNNND